MATKNIKNKAGKNSILKNPVVIVLTFIAMTALILASSFCTAQKNKVDITQIVLNGNIQLAVGENQAVGFNVATPKVLDNDLVVNAVNKLDLVWTVEDEKVATYDEDAGTICGVSEGTTSLSVSTKDGKLSDTCLVTVTPKAELLSGLAMLDAGVSNCSNYDKTITKQKFLDAQKAVAKSLNFTKEMNGKVKFGDMFSLIDDGHIKVDEKGNIKADEDSGLATIELINLYNMMVPVYLSFRNLSEAYKEEIQSSLSDSLFGNAKNSDSEKLMKKIEELEKMLDKAKADAARAIEAENAAEQKLIQSKKRENALTSKLETAYKEIDELMERIPEPEEAEVVCEAEEERQEPVQQVQAKDYAAALDALLKQHTVVIVGGNENLMKKFQVAHPDASLVAKDMLGTCDQQIQNADIVMFKVDSCSHALYNKGKTICNRYDVPFCYIPNVASIPRIEQSMCEQLEEIFS